jgi:hypothetical protein
MQTEISSSITTGQILGFCGVVLSVVGGFILVIYKRRVKKEDVEQDRVQREKDEKQKLKDDEERQFKADVWAAIKSNRDAMEEMNEKVIETSVTLNLLGKQHDKNHGGA